MSKNSSLKREAKKQRDIPQEHKTSDVVVFERKRKQLEPLNESQRQFISALKHDKIVIGAGAAGTGKTYLSSRIAGELYLQSKNFKQIILTRPNVEAGEKLGYLPGELHEKYEPYMEPFKDGLIDQLGAKFQSDLYKKILPQPLGYMRGRTFDDSLILLDEAQNISVHVMKMICTRIGTNSRLFITGDTKQSDLRGREMNGLEWLISEIERQQKPIEVVRFRKEDCVRSDECKMMLDLIENSEL